MWTETEQGKTIRLRKKHNQPQKGNYSKQTKAKEEKKNLSCFYSFRKLLSRQEAYAAQIKKNTNHKTIDNALLTRNSHLLSR